MNRRWAVTLCACGAASALGVGIGDAGGAGIDPERSLTTVTITVAQPTLTLGLDGGTTLAVTVLGPLASAARPGRTQATVGFIGPLVAQATPGSFAAEYRVPTDRLPQAALLSVEVILPDGASVYSVTRLMLPAAATFPLRTSPQAEVSLEIAGRTFGPQKADAAGDVSIPIVVPAGVVAGRARAVNKFGIATETEVNLQPRDYPRVLLIAPSHGEAGAAVDVEVWAVEPSGDPAPPENIDLRASLGEVRRVAGMPGLARFAFTVPPLVGAGALTLMAAMNDGASERSDSLTIRAGPASAVSIAADTTRLVVGSGAMAHLTILARDRFGNTVPVDGVVITGDGHPLPVRLENVQGNVEASIDVPAPSAWRGRDHMAIEATLGKLRAVTKLLVTGGNPAGIQLTASHKAIEGNNRNGVEVVLEVFDERGTPTSASRVVWQTDDNGSLETLTPFRLGTYAVRFTARRTLRDRAAVISVTVDSRLTASRRVVVQAGAARLAAARVGLVSNLGGLFGQSAFLEGNIPLSAQRFGRVARFFSVGLAAAYLRSEGNLPAAGTEYPSLHLNVNQTPIMALGRVRMPGQLPVEFSLSGMAGVTFASITVIPDEDSSFQPTRATARALVLGLGVDASFLLQPGELVIGARYLDARLGRNSNGDYINGNTLGLVCDFGFRIGF
ncbi:MAG: hypothetical protein H7X95_02620 [Deltaproteobacteria bacterium]|nr:hypothetical protein [Deltaproteobacteria bacterium]